MSEKDVVTQIGSQGGLLGMKNDADKMRRIKEIEDKAGLNREMSRAERDAKNQEAANSIKRDIQTSNRRMMNRGPAGRGQTPVLRDPDEIDSINDCRSDEEKVAFIESKLMPEIRRKHLEEDPELGKYNDYIESAWAESVLNDDIYKNEKK